MNKVNYSHNIKNEVYLQQTNKKDNICKHIYMFRNRDNKVDYNTDCQLSVE